MINVYGLKNCDTCRKARKWMDGENIAYNFYDARVDGINAGQVSMWAKAVGWEVLLNKRGTTWRGLDADIKATIDEDSAIALMVKHPALVKRPVFVVGDKIVVGFSIKEQDQLKI